MRVLQKQIMDTLNLNRALKFFPSKKIKEFGKLPIQRKVRKMEGHLTSVTPEEGKNCP